MAADFGAEDSLRFGSIGAQLDRLCDEFEAAWHQGASPPQIEAFVNRAPDELRARLLLELLFLDVAYRRAHGQHPKSVDYAKRFPDHVDLIAQALVVPSISDPWPADRLWLQNNILFGLVAHQNGLVTRPQLLEVIGQWKHDKRRSLAEVLQAQQLLNANMVSALQLPATSSAMWANSPAIRPRSSLLSAKASASVNDEWARDRLPTRTASSARKRSARGRRLRPSRCYADSSVAAFRNELHRAAPFPSVPQLRPNRRQLRSP